MNRANLRSIMILTLVFGGFGSSIIGQTSTDLPASVNRSIGTYRVVDLDDDNKKVPVVYVKIRLKKGVAKHREATPNESKILVDGEIRLRNEKCLAFVLGELGPVDVEGDEYIKSFHFISTDGDQVQYEFFGEFLDKVKQNAPGGPFIKIRGKLTEIRAGNSTNSWYLELYETADL